MTGPLASYHAEALIVNQAKEIADQQSTSERVNLAITTSFDRTDKPSSLLNTVSFKGSEVGSSYANIRQQHSGLEI